MKKLWKASWEEIMERKTKWEGDCLIWTAGCHSQDYPMTRYNGKMVKVDRTLIEKKFDITLKKEQRVKNTCGNIKCVNVEHYDLIERDDVRWKCISHAYTPEQRKHILSMYDDYAHPNTGTKFGVWMDVKKHYPNISKSTLKKILRER